MQPAWLNIFPLGLRELLEKLPREAANALEEIRIRENRPLEIGYGGKYAFVLEDGTLTEHHAPAYRPGREICRAMLESVTNHSLYAVEEELKRGFVTVPGGHRIGLAGRTVLEKGAVRHLRDIAAFNVRIARARAGCGASVIPGLLDWEAKTIRHTLIVSPPQQGKTTLLRDLVRCISSGEWHHPGAKSWGGRKVGIVDERSEIAASERGVPTFDVGPRTDVLDACPKAEGLMMMVRSLSPEVVAVDEIGRPEDAAALHDALRAGVRVLATAHAADLADVYARPVLADLVKDGVFGAFVLLSRMGGVVKSRIVTAEDADAEAARRSKPPIGAAPRDAPDPQALRPSVGPPAVAVSVRTRLPAIRSPDDPAPQRSRGSDHA
jgi:stage III sporulation protein AA